MKGDNMNIEELANKNTPEPQRQLQKSDNRRKLKIYLGITFFLSTLVNTLLEIFREIFIITKQTPSSIYFIKLCLTFPMTFVLMLCVQKALNRFSLTSIYKFITINYVIFFLIVGIFLLPNEDKIQKGRLWVLSHTCNGKLQVRGLKFVEPIIYIFGEWIYTLLYVLSELWGAFMVSYLFFTFANSMCTKSEMEAILPFLSSLTAFSMILSAGLYTIFNFIKQRVSYNASVSITSISFISIGCLTLVIYFLTSSTEKLFKKKQNTVDIPLKIIKNTDNLSKLLESRLLRNISLTCLIYAFNCGIIEASFKNSLADGSIRKDIPTDQYSSVFISTAFALVSISILVINTCFYKKLKNLGWLFSSMISPVVSLSFTVIICCLSFYNYPSKTQKGLFLNGFLQDKPKFLDLENWTVVLSIVLIKMCKFVNFDMTKETLSMRIPEAHRVKYKSVYDGICIKLGKTLSALYGAFFTMLGITDIRKVAPISLVIMLITNYFWIKAVLYINNKYQQSLVHNQEIDVDLPKETEE